MKKGLGANVRNRTRKAVYEREGYRCALCDSTRQLELHHIIKRSQGGTDNPENLICLCHYCHLMAHGEKVKPECLDDLPFTERDMEVEIAAYMAELWACTYGEVWNPGW